MLQLISFALTSYLGVVAVACGVPYEALPSLIDPAEPTAYICTIRVDDAQFIATGEIFRLGDGATGATDEPKTEGPTL